MDVALVTGAAGFVGSHLVEALLADGRHVRGIDCFTPYYDRATKEANLAEARRNGAFEFHEADLRTTDLASLLEDVEVVFHQAAQPGVRLSWAEGFAEYESCNLLVTQRLLEATRGLPLRRFVYASSSSVYGNAQQYPTSEASPTDPHSPYGVTKLAAEHLCRLYASNYGVPTVSLRYFTVYGPRQRPDMATHRLIEAALNGQPFPLYGDGSHVRDFTYVGDVVAANLLASRQPLPAGEVINICAGGSVTMSELIEMVGTAVEGSVSVDLQPEQPGDVHRTGGDSTVALKLLGWSPQTSLSHGLSAQVAWHLAQRRSGPPPVVG